MGLRGAGAPTGAGVDSALSVSSLFSFFLLVRPLNPNSSRPGFSHQHQAPHEQELLHGSLWIAAISGHFSSLRI